MPERDGLVERLRDECYVETLCENDLNATLFVEAANALEAAEKENGYVEDAFWAAHDFVEQLAEDIKAAEQRIEELEGLIEKAARTFEQRQGKRQGWDERKAVTYREAARYLRLHFAALSQEQEK